MLKRVVKAPGFAAGAILLIAIGIGTATTIFTLLDALLLRTLPVRNPENLVQVVQLFSNLRPQGYFAFELYRRLAEESSTLFDVTGQSEMTVTLDSGTRPLRVYAQAVTDNFFKALGVQATVGTVFGGSDPAVAVLSYEGWTKYFGRDATAVGRTVRLNGHPFQIVGVTPQGFNGTNSDTTPAIRVSYRFITQLSGRDDDGLEIIARLRPGVPLDDARKEVSSVWLSLPEAMPGARTSSRIEVRSIEHGASYLRDQFRTALIVLMAGTALLLLMVCCNIGGLLLARSAVRAKETAVRLAIGAPRMRIIAECLIDSLAVTFLGLAAALPLAYAGVGLLVRSLPQLPISSFDLRTSSVNVGVGLRPILFAVTACVVTAMLSALPPAWRALRDDLYGTLRGTISDIRHRRLQAVLCSIQVALCLILIISAGLMIRTVSNLTALDPGFDKAHLATFSIDPTSAKYNSQQIWSLQQRLLAEAQSVSGVEAAAIGGMSLMRGIGIVTGIAIPGQGQQLTNMNFVTPEYFDVMKMRVVAGRTFQAGDKPDGKPARRRQRRVRAPVLRQTRCRRVAHRP
jgi:predicted permease